MQLKIPNDFFLSLYRNKSHPDITKSHENTPRFLLDLKLGESPLSSILLSYPFSGFLRSFKDPEKGNQIKFECVFSIFTDAPGTKIHEDKDRVFGVKNLVESSIVDLDNFTILCSKAKDDDGKDLEPIPTPTHTDFFPNLAEQEGKQGPDTSELSSLPPVSIELLKTLSTINSVPTPSIKPCKIIPIPPEVVLKLHEIDLSNFDLVLKTTRDCFIEMAKSINNDVKKISFFHSSFQILQLLWLHTRPQDKIDISTYNFLHDTPGPFATTSEDWAEWKVESMANLYTKTSSSSSTSTSDNPDRDDDAMDIDDSKCTTIQERLLNRSLKVLDHAVKIRESSSSSSEKQQLLKEDFFGYNAFLIAGSADGTCKAAEIHNQLRSVLLKPSKVACSSISNFLNTRNGCTMLIDYALAQAVRNLDIFRQNPEALGKFSLMFCVPRRMDELTTAMDERAINVRLEAKIANDNLINKITDSKPDLAFDSSTWHLTMKNFYYFIKFLWSEFAIITKIASKLVTVVDNNRLAIDSMAASNPFLIPKYFWLINNRFHNWLDSCTRADACEEAHWSDIKNLPELVDDLLRNHSIPNIEMPIAMKKLVHERYEKKFGRSIYNNNNKRRPGEDGGGDVLGGGGAYRKKQRIEQPGGDDNDDRIRDPTKFNPNVPSEWKMSQKAFRKIISPNADNSPKVNDKAVCLLYHIQGKCARGRACIHSHEALNDATKEEMTNFIAACKLAVNQS